MRLARNRRFAAFGVLVLTYVVLGASVAHAAPLPLSSGVGGDLAHHALSFLENGVRCMTQLGLASLLELAGMDPEAQTGCAGLRGGGIALLALAALVVIALGRMRLQTEQKRLDVAQRLVEQGIEPPAGLLMGPAVGDLRKGVVLLFAGAGLFVAGLFIGDRGLAAGGLVPEFIGVGYLVSYWLAARDRPGTRGPPTDEERS